MTVSACSSGTFTQEYHTADTIYRHSADMSLSYPLMGKVTLEYTTNHFNVLDDIQLGNPSLTFHTHQQTLNLMMLLWW